MSTKIASIADALTDLRRSEPAVDAAGDIDFNPAAFVKRERALIAKLATSSSGSLADAVAKAGELASLLAGGDYLDDLTPRLAKALAADLARLSRGARCSAVQAAAALAAPCPGQPVAASMGHG